MKDVDLVEDTETNELAEQIMRLERSLRQSTGQVPQGTTPKVRKITHAQPEPRRAVSVASISLSDDPGMAKLNSSPRSRGR